MTKGDGDQSNKKYEPIPPSSPLYLHPSESPNLSLSPIPFNGDNYELWADAVRNGLEAKNKLTLVEGTVNKPEVEEGEEETMEAVAWRQCNAMIKGWLRSSIDSKLHSSISFKESVVDIWKELRDRYSTGNAPRIHQLKTDLAECKQGKSQSVVDYYTQLKSLWDELGNYVKIPDCNCGAAAAILKDREDEKVHQFLMGLDTSRYGNIRSNLLMEDEIPPLNKVYAVVLREERHRLVTKSKEEVQEAAMAIRGSNTRTSEPSKDGDAETTIRCTYCNKLWHTEDKCWEKLGIAGRGRGRGRSRGRGGRGRGITQHANAATTSNEDGKNTLDQDEVAQLRALLGGKSDASTSKKGPIYEDEDWEG